MAACRETYPEHLKLPGMMSVARAMIRFPAGVGQCLVNHLVEIIKIQNFSVRSACSFIRHYPCRRGVFNADPHAQRIVRFDRRREFALRIDNKWEPDAMLLGKFFRESAQVRFCFNAGLICKYRVAEFIADFFRFRIEPASVHGRVEAPDVHPQRKVVPDPRNVVLLCGVFQDWIDGGTAGTFHILKLNDSDAGADWWLKCAGVVNLGRLRGLRPQRGNGDECKKGNCPNETLQECLLDRRLR